MPLPNTPLYSSKHWGNIGVAKKYTRGPHSKYWRGPAPRYRRLRFSNKWINKKIIIVISLLFMYDLGINGHICLNDLTEDRLTERNCKYKCMFILVHTNATGWRSEVRPRRRRQTKGQFLNYILNWFSPSRIRTVDVQICRVWIIQYIDYWV